MTATSSSIYYPITTFASLLSRFKIVKYPKYELITPQNGSYESNLFFSSKEFHQWEASNELLSIFELVKLFSFLFSTDFFNLIYFILFRSIITIYSEIQRVPQTMVCINIIYNHFISKLFLNQSKSLIAKHFKLCF